MKLARIHAIVPVVVVLLASVVLLSQPRDHVAAAQGDKGDANKDLESLKGTWNVDTMGWGDKSLPKELINGYKFVFDGNKLTWTAPLGMMSKGGKITPIRDGSHPCDFKIDPSKKPKEIDITMHMKQGDRTVLGIYEIKGDALKVYFASSNTGKRPTEFSTNNDPSAGYLTLTRAKK